ncbi:MAG TPA: ABC transporter substrate-binding protein [Chloroflexota bacterium]|nr:ABC transporter substrate-binding protein [Chloroflexota bacterium]
MRSLVAISVLALSACGGTAAPPSSAPASTAASTAPKPSAAASAAAKPSAAVSAAPASAGGSAAGSANGGLPHVKIAYSQPTSGFAHLWIAADKGYFKKYGLDAEVVQITPPADTSALLANEIQFDFDGAAGINAIAGGAPIPFIAITNPTFTQAFYGRPEVKKMSDIIGKTVAATTRGGSSDIALRQMLDREKIDINQVKLTYLRDDSAILASLQSGAVQAAMLTSPNTLRARDAGMNQLLDLATVRWHTINQGVNVRDDWAKSHQDEVLAFLKGELEGMHDAKTDPQLTKETITKWTKVTDPALLDEAYRSGNAGWTADPLAHDDDIQGVIDYSTEASVKTHKPQEFYDNSYLDKLQDFIKALYPQGIPQ